MMTRLLGFAFVLAACGDSKGGTAIDAASGSDAAVDTATAGDGASDTTGPTADASVGTTCGAATCGSNQECCAGTGGSTCVDQGNCMGVAFGCDGPEDCPNEVCCFGGPGGPGAQGSECTAANQCQNTACHEMTDCGGNTPMCCDVGQTGYKVCLSQCPQ